MSQVCFFPILFFLAIMANWIISCFRERRKIEHQIKQDDIDRIHLIYEIACRNEMAHRFERNIYEFVKLTNAKAKSHADWSRDGF